MSSSSMRTSCSFFRDVQDIVPQAWSGSWSDLVDRLRQVHKPNGGLRQEVAKKSLPSVCASTFLAGKTRAREHVTGVRLVILDFDNAREVTTGEFHRSGRPKTRKVVIGNPATMAEIETCLKNAGVAALAWSTWSDKPEWPKFRVVIPLAIPVPGAAWGQYADLVVDDLGLGPWREALDLPVLRNPAALAFLPAAHGARGVRFFHLEGTTLPVSMDRLEARKVACRALEEGHAPRSGPVGGDQWWKRYCVDGRPVDFRKLDLVPILARLGCRVGSERPWAGGIKLRCTCPWSDEHTGGVDDDAAFVILRQGKWPVFGCSHTGHEALGLRDLLEAAWGRP